MGGLHCSVAIVRACATAESECPMCYMYYVQDDTPKLADVYSTLSVVYITTINKAVDYIMSCFVNGTG